MGLSWCNYAIPGINSQSNLPFRDFAEFLIYTGIGPNPPNVLCCFRLFALGLTGLSTRGGLVPVFQYLDLVSKNRAVGGFRHALQLWQCYMHAEAIITTPTLADTRHRYLL
jgi:hypothetical protein